MFRVEPLALTPSGCKDADNADILNEVGTIYFMDAEGDFPD